MFKAEFSKYFQKQYKKLIKNNKLMEGRIDTALTKLLHDPEIVSHKVGQYWNCRVTGAIRIIWEYQDDELVLLLLKIGRHGEVY